MSNWNEGMAPIGHTPAMPAKIKKRPDELDAAKEAKRRGYGPNRERGFVMGAAAQLNGQKLPVPGLRELGWRNEGAEWARLALQSFHHTAPTK